MMKDKKISPDRRKNAESAADDGASVSESIFGKAGSAKRDASKVRKDPGTKKAPEKTAPVQVSAGDSVKTPTHAERTSANKSPAGAAKPAGKKAAPREAAKPAQKKAVPREAAKITSLHPADLSEAIRAEAAKPASPADSAEEILSTDLSQLNPILETGANEISVPLSAENIRAFTIYAKLLKEWNEKMNLTNITDDRGIAIRHFVDSLTLIPHLEEECIKKGKKNLSLIDVGTGAGFPGIPLKVAMPSLEVTLLDSLRKRVGFLDAVCAALDLQGIITVHSRAEDAGTNKQYREKYDAATARAVASLPVLCEYCLPFVKVGGIFLAMKGNVEEEAEESKKAIVTLGGTIETLHSFTLPGTDMKRSIIVIRKVRATPARYPRHAGKPEKEPIL